MSKQLDAEKRREALRIALLNLNRNQNVADAEKKIISEICYDAICGHDPRQLLGVTPKRGPRTRSDEIEKKIAIHYWALRDCEPKMMSKRAAAEVSRHWNINPLRVEKIGRKRRAWAKGVIDNNTTTLPAFFPLGSLSLRRNKKFWKPINIGSSTATLVPPN